MKMKIKAIQFQSNIPGFGLKLDDVDADNIVATVEPHPEGVVKLELVKKTNPPLPVTLWIPWSQIKALYEK